MASAITDIKKKRGRPPKAGGIDPGVFVRLPPDTIEAVDQDAAARGMTRSAVIREAVEEAVRYIKKDNARRLKAKGKAR